MGRKHCANCGHWRLVVDFFAKKRDEDGNVTKLASICAPCQRAYWRTWANRPPVLSKRRAEKREYQRVTRRLMGQKPRYPDERGYTGQYPLEPYRPLTAKGRQDKMVDATAFLAWYDNWRDRQEAMRGTAGPGDNLNWMALAGAEDVCELAGFSFRRISDARRTGRIDYAKAEAFLVNAGCQEPWCVLDDVDELAA